VALEDFFSGTRISRGFWVLYVKNADCKMSGEPNSTEEQDDAEDEFGGNGGGALNGRLNSGDFESGCNKDVHGGKGHGDDEERGENGSEDLFHGV
jgi:hypothetical protein